MQKLVL